MLPTRTKRKNIESPVGQLTAEKVIARLDALDNADMLPERKAGGRWPKTGPWVSQFSRELPAVNHRPAEVVAAEDEYAKTLAHVDSVGDRLEALTKAGDFAAYSAAKAEHENAHIVIQQARLRLETVRLEALSKQADLFAQIRAAATERRESIEAQKILLDCEAVKWENVARRASAHGAGARETAAMVKHVIAETESLNGLKRIRDQIRLAEAKAKGQVYQDMPRRTEVATFTIRGHDVTKINGKSVNFR